MMRSFILLAALAAASSAWAQADAPSSAGPPPPRRHPTVIENPDFIRGPTPEEFGSLFPPHAMQVGLSGAAVIQCEVTVDGRLTGCRALSEDPPGEGFGDAAVKVAKFFVMKPKRIDGTPVSGGTFTTQIQFTLQTGH